MPVSRFFSAPPPLAALPPADELALVRAEIDRLRQREAALAACLRQRPDLCRQGRATRVELAELTLNRLIVSRLPPEIRDDPAFRATRQVTLLRCLPLPAATVAVTAARPPPRARRHLN